MTIKPGFGNLVDLDDQKINFNNRRGEECIDLDNMD